MSCPESSSDLSSTGRKAGFFIRNQVNHIFVTGRNLGGIEKRNIKVCSKKGRLLVGPLELIGREKKILKITIMATPQAPCPKSSSEANQDHVIDPGDLCDLTITIDDEDIDFEDIIDDPEYFDEP
ncbi:hypothetical protein BH23PLA1_BH23PLA1_19770 [soil metagenome]